MEEKERELLFCLTGYEGDTGSRPIRSILQKDATALESPERFPFFWTSRYRCPANSIASNLGLRPSDEVKYFQRLISFREFPIAIEMFWLTDVQAAAPIDLTTNRGQLETALQQYAVEQSICYRAMSAKHAQYMEIPADTMTICLESLICAREENRFCQLSRLFVIPDRGYLSTVQLG